MAAIAVLAPVAAGAALKRSLPRPARLVRCRNADALQRLVVSRLVDAVVLSPLGAGLALLRDLRATLPTVPVVAWAPFRPEDAETLDACREAGVAAMLVEGVDDAVAADLLGRVTLAAVRRDALADGPRALRLSEPLQRRVWDLAVREVERPLRTGDIARRLRVSREHLSRQFGAGGAPNLKRVIDLGRIACAAQLLANTRLTPPIVAVMLSFATASHLSLTARRIADAPTSALAGLGPAGVLAAFVAGRTRSRA
jgi:AraC-like DNA-binding protein